MIPKTIARFPSGVVHTPPSKSLSHRAVICAALAEGRSVINHLGSSRDIEVTAGCMAALGARVTREDGGADSSGTKRLIVEGVRRPVSNGETLDCGESGTTLRFLLPLAALADRETRFTGQGRLMERPMEPFEAAFAAHGATLARTDGGLTVRGPLSPGRYELPGDVSSQFVSGLLFALPLLNGDSEIVMTSPLESASYVDLTLSCLRDFGIEIVNESYGRFVVRGGQSYRTGTYQVEGDYSQAAFFLVAGAFGAPVECRGLRPDSLQGDRRILELLQNAGVDVNRTPEGGLIVRSPRHADGRLALRGQRVDVSDIPDLVPPLAAFMSVCEGESEIVNAARLRFKECDRLAAVTQELNALGANIRETQDALTITGVPELAGGEIRAWGDHRIAMMAAVAALCCRNPVTIDDPLCVRKSYPDFWADYERVPEKDLSR